MKEGSGKGALGEDPEGYAKEGSGNSHLSPKGPHWEHGEDVRLPETLAE
jgi:hypothetical protein